MTRGVGNRPSDGCKCFYRAVAALGTRIGQGNSVPMTGSPVAAVRNAVNRIWFAPRQDLS